MSQDRRQASVSDPYEHAKQIVAAILMDRFAGDGETVSPLEDVIAYSIATEIFLALTRASISPFASESRPVDQ